jgi:hypothetical protein
MVNCKRRNAVIMSLVPCDFSATRLLQFPDFAAFADGQSPPLGMDHVLARASPDCTDSGCS